MLLTNINGAVAELRFREWLVRQGFEVAVPVTDSSPVDILWRPQSGDYWRSAQVKKVYYKAARSPRDEENPEDVPRFPTVDLLRADKKRYEAGDADYLACVDIENEKVWLIRFPAVCDVGRLRLGGKWRSFLQPLNHRG